MDMYVTRIRRSVKFGRTEFNGGKWGEGGLDFYVCGTRTCVATYVCGTRRALM